MRELNKFYMEIYRHALPTDEEDVWMSIDSLDAHPDIIQALADLGIVEVRRGYMPAGHAVRVGKLFRLRRGLGVNLPGAAVILDLLERVEMLEEEIARLKRR